LLLSLQEDTEAKMKRRDFLKTLGAGFAYSLLPSFAKSDERMHEQGESGEAPEESGESSAEQCIKVPVLMYHAINRQDSDYSRTPARFAHDLEFLYENEYKLTSIEELVTGTMRADKPVVLTFDDARDSQFHLDENNNIDSECAVGIMNEFCDSHPDFGKTAMFYVSFDSNAAFGQRSKVGWKLNYLLDNGYEIGNHTMWHDNLSLVSLDKLKETITTCRDELEKHLGEMISRVKSFCFPYCAVPSSDSALDFIRSSFTSATIGGGRSFCNNDLHKIPRIGIANTTSIERIVNL